MQLALPPRVTDRAFARLSEIGAARAARGRRGRRLLRLPVRHQARRRRPPDDLVLEKDGVRVLIDPVSLPFLADAEIDFADELIGARFVVNNPNATSSCGCGTSFSI